MTHGVCIVISRASLLKLPTGTKAEVWRGKADKTKGGLLKSDLKRNKKGQIVSKRASAHAAARSNLKGFLIRPRGTRKRKQTKRYKPT